jgi:hypothetical protein
MISTVSTKTQDSAANTEQTVTVAAQGGYRHYVTGYEVTIAAAQVGAADITILIKDGTAVIWKDVIGATAARGTNISKVFKFPLRMTIGNKIDMVVSAGGANVVTSANLLYFSEYGAGTQTPMSGTAIPVSQDATAAINTITVTGTADLTYYVTGFHVATSGAAAGANDITVSVKNGSTTIWKDLIGAAAAQGTRVGINFDVPLKITKGANLVLDASAGGAGCITSANLAYYTTSE